MDQNVLSILLGLATNGLTSLLARLGQRIGDALVGREFLEKWELEKTSLQPILQRAINEIAEDIHLDRSSTEEIACLFLFSPEVEEIVCQIYSTELLGRTHQSGLISIEQVFVTSFSIFLDLYPSTAKLGKEKRAQSANFVFDALLKACDLALGYSIDSGILAAHEARSAFRHRILLDEFTAIQKKLDFLTVRHYSSIQDVLAFEKKYRQQVCNRHKDIIPPYLDVVKKLPLNKIYISPRLAAYSKNDKTKPTELLEVPDFLSGIFRAVILGNPGAGKSTFALNLCYEFTNRSSKRSFSGRKHVTPILVILREYGAEKKARNCSILQFIEIKANASYQVSPPDGAFEYLLLNGRVLVIFDGLDELLDTSYRQEVSGDVESFCNLYPSVPVLVTSREVGYEQAPLDENKFPVYYLTPFNEQQVKIFVKKWFDASYKDFSREERDRKAESFLEESTVAPDLRSNPLMLALMCNIYRGENYLPRNRPDVYEKCAVMLFERWDKSRSIRVILPFDWHLRPIMEYLAFWIFINEGLRGGVTEDELITKTTEYICEWIFDDYNKAERAARDFIEFCTGRAWVFTDTGTKREGEKLYQFTHTTFLEYFTASHLVRIYREPGALLHILLPRIAKEEWDVMSQLAFQLQNKKIAGAGDELLTSILDHAAEARTMEAWRLLSFATRSLEFIIPRPKVTRSVIKACIDRMIKDGIKRTRPSEKLYRNISGAFAGIRGASFENMSIISEYSTQYLLDLIKNNAGLNASLALEISLSACRWTINPIFENCAEQLETIFSHDFALCYEAVVTGRLSVVKMIDWFGSSAIFRMQESILLNRVSLGQLFARRILDGPHEMSFSNWLMSHVKFLREIGPMIRSHLPLIISHSQKDKRSEDFFADFYFSVNFNPRKIYENSFELDSQALFGAFILFAILLEAAEIARTQNVSSVERFVALEVKLKVIKLSKCRFFDFIRWIFCARYEKIEETKVEMELSKCNFSEEQQDFIWGWIKREVDLVKFAGTI